MTDHTAEIVSATLTVAAPATTVFEVLADPVSHAAIDGTGWVRRPVDQAPLSEVGQLFRMDMRFGAHPDGDYRVVNRVEVFDSPHAIGWLTGTENEDGSVELGGWLWRYDLTPLAPSETRVTLSYDWSAVPRHIRDRGIPFPPFGPDHLANSLRHLAGLAG
jgi:hypothetical protein